MKIETKEKTVSAIGFLFSLIFAATSINSFYGYKHPNTVSHAAERISLTQNFTEQAALQHTAIQTDQQFHAGKTLIVPSVDTNDPGFKKQVQAQVDQVIGNEEATEIKEHVLNLMAGFETAGLSLVALTLGSRPIEYGFPKC